MRRFWLAAVCTAGAVAICSAAEATVMVATFTGPYDVVDTSGLLGPPGIYYIYDSPYQDHAFFGLTVKFDTQLGTLTNQTFSGGGVGQTLAWNAGDVASDPITSLGVSISGRATFFTPYEPFLNYLPPKTVVWSPTTIQSATISRNPIDGLSLKVVASDGYIDIRSGVQDGLKGIYHAPNVGTRLDQPFAEVEDFMPGQIAVLGFGASPYVDQTNLSIFGPSPAVPEPTSWALMIVGLGAVGSLLRRSRQVCAQA